MHPLTNRYLLYEPMNEPDFEFIFNDLLQKEVLYLYENNGAETGMFKLVPQQYRNSHTGYLGGVAIHPEAGGKGQGTIMLQEIIALGAAMGLQRIELSTAVMNEKAIRLYQKTGFEQEGILRKYTHLKKENIFLDEVMMAYLY
jgi:RimJ/RimL family protein N-acetyltransferase